MEKVMTVSNTASKPEGLDLNSVDTKTLVEIILQQRSSQAESDAKIAELEAKVNNLESKKNTADPGTAFLNVPGPNFKISDAQKAKGFWTVTDMIMDQDYKKGDIMTITLWKPAPGAKEGAIGRLNTQPKWTGEEPAATDDDDLSVL